MPSIRFEEKKFAILNDPAMTGVGGDVSWLARLNLHVTHVAVLTLGVSKKDAAKTQLCDPSSLSSWRGRKLKVRAILHNVSLREEIRQAYYSAKEYPPPMIEATTKSRRLSPGSREPRMDLHAVSKPFPNPDGQGHVRFRMYGRSADEAKQLARLVVEHFTKRAAAERTDFDRARAANAKKLADAHAEIKTAEETLNELNRYLEKHPTNEILANELLVEFDKQLRLVSIEITGLEAERQAVQGGNVDRETALRKLRYELDVELAGALARRNAITAELTSAKKALERAALRANLKRLGKDLESFQRETSKFETIAKDPPLNCFTPPIVVDNVVTIVPVGKQ